MILAGGNMMGVLVLLLASLGASGILFGFWWIFARIMRWNLALKHVSRELGIDHYPSGLTVKGFASGTSRGMRLTVDTRWQIANPFRWVEVLLPGGERPIRAFTRVTVWLRGGDDRLVLRARPVTEGGVRKQFYEHDVLTQDDSFDQAIIARGPADEVLASLDVHAREAARVTVVELGACLKDGAIQIEKPGYIEDGAALSVMARACVSLAAALRQDGRDASQRLYQRFDQDPHHAVRTRALGLLMARHPVSPGARQAATDVLTAVDPGLVPSAPDAQDRLLSLLSRNDAPLVREVSAWALGRVGTTACVPALEQLRDARPTSAELARICSNALQRISENPGRADSWSGG